MPKEGQMGTDANGRRVIYQNGQTRVLSPQEEARIDATKRAALTPGIIRSISQGVGFNFADDIDANLAAGTTAVNNALGGALFGKKSYTPQQAKAAVLQAEREASEKYARDNPVASGVGTIGGAILSPVNKALMPLATSVRLGKAAPVVAGAVGGGLAGYGQDGTTGAAQGAAGGAILGGVLPKVFNAGVQAAAPVVRRGVNAIPQDIRNAVDAGIDAVSQSRAARTGVPAPPPRVAPPGAQPRPQINPSELKTARVLQNAIDRDAKAGVQFKPGANPMYEGGENLAGVYEAAANYPGAARPQISQAITKNRREASQGVVDDIANVLGGKGDFFTYQKKLVETQRANAKTGMEKIGDQMVTLNPDAILALRSDKAREALKNGADNMRASIDPDVRSQANQLLGVLDQVFDNPSGVTLRVRDAQNISEKLLSASDTAWRSGDGGSGKALGELGRAIRGNARDPNQGGVSAYDDWLRQYSSDAENKRALELGRDILKSNLWPGDLDAQLSEMGPGSLIHYQKGVAETLLNKVQSAGGDMRVMRQLLDDQNLSSKIQTAFPDDASFAAFLQSAERRVQDANRNNSFTANSRTQFRNAAQSDMEDQSSFMAEAVDQALNAMSNPTAVPGNVAKATLKGLGFGSPTKGVLKDEAANAALGRTALDPEEVTRLLNMLQTMKAREAVTTNAARRAVPALGAAAVPMYVR